MYICDRKEAIPPTFHIEYTLHHTCHSYYLYLYVAPSRGTYILCCHRMNKLVSLSLAIYSTQSLPTLNDLLHPTLDSQALYLYIQYVWNATPIMLITFLIDIVYLYVHLEYLVELDVVEGLPQDRMEALVGGEWRSLFCLGSSIGIGRSNGYHFLVGLLYLVLMLLGLDIHLFLSFLLLIVYIISYVCTLLLLKNHLYLSLIKESNLLFYILNYINYHYY